MRFRPIEVPETESSEGLNKSQLKKRIGTRCSVLSISKALDNYDITSQFYDEPTYKQGRGH